MVAVAWAYFWVLRAQALGRVARHQSHWLAEFYRQTKTFLMVGTGDGVAVEGARANEGAGRRT
ncbi:MAG: hypothetical protein ACYDEV_04020 [Acidiferrobacter sp.]